MKSTEKPYILIVTELFPADDKSYTGTFVLDQLKALMPHYNFVVLAPSFPAILKYLFTPDIRYKKISDIRVYFIKDSSNDHLVKKIWRKITSDKTVSQKNYQIKIGYRNKLLKLAQKLHQQYNFQLVHGHECFIGDEAAVIGNALHIPSIITIHGLYNLHLESWGAQTMDLILDNLRHSSKLLSISHKAGDSYAPHLLPNKPDIAIIPNGINTMSQIIASPALLRFKKQIKNRKVILAVGTLVWYKKFDLLIECAKQAYEALGDAFIISIAGNGSEDLKLRALVKRYGLLDNVYFIGAIPPKLMSGWYEIADFLAHPSIIDSFSMVCLESMAHSKPIICTSAIGITEYITNKKEGFIVAPDSVNDFTAAIKTLLLDDSLRQQMGKYAYRRSLDFHWNQITPKIRSIYESIS